MRLKKSWQRAGENAKALNASFTSVFTDKTGFQESHAPETCGKVQIKENSVEKNQATEHLGKLDTDKSMGPHKKHAQVLRELADGTVRPFLIIFEGPWQLEEVPHHGKKNVIPIFKKDKEEDPGTTDWPALPQSLHQILLEAISRYEGQEDGWG